MSHWSSNLPCWCAVPLQTEGGKDCLESIGRVLIKGDKKHPMVTLETSSVYGDLSTLIYQVGLQDGLSGCLDTHRMKVRPCAGFLAVSSPRLTSYHKSSLPRLTPYHKSSSPRLTPYHKSSSPRLTSYHKSSSPRLTSYHKSSSPRLTPYQESPSPFTIRVRSQRASVLSASHTQTHNLYPSELATPSPHDLTFASQRSLVAPPLPFPTLAGLPPLPFV